MVKGTKVEQEGKSIALVQKEKKKMFIKHNIPAN